MSPPDPSDNWRAQAACAGLDVNLFIPEGRGDKGERAYKEARLICDTCPVSQPCLAYALREHIEEGMWGGTTPKERKKIGFGRPPIFCETCRVRFVPMSTRQLYCSPGCAKVGKRMAARST